MENKTILSKIALFQKNGNWHELTCGNDSQHLPLIGKEKEGKVILYCVECGYENDYIPSLVFGNDYKEWWQSLSAADRFPLMRKYDVKQVNDKFIKRMWRGEFLNCL
jgi:hypothetical protein